MRRRWLIAVLGAIAAVALAITWLVTSTTGLYFVLTRVAARIPGDISIATLDGRLIGPIHITDLQYKGDAAELRLARLSIDWTPLALLGGQLRLTRIDGRGVHLQLPTGDGGPPVLPAVKLPVAVAVTELRVEDIVIARADVAAPLRINRVELAAHTRAGTLHVGRLALLTPALDLSMDGRITPHGQYPHDMAVRWTARIPGYPPASGAGRVSGDVERVRIAQRMTAPFIADLAAEVTAPLTELGWDATLKFGVLPLPELQPGWPGPALRGNLRGRGDRTSLDVEGTLALADRAAGELTLAARVDWAQAERPVQFQVQGDWQNIAWPWKGAALVSSARGTLRAHGDAADYALTLSADLTHARAGGLRVSANANGGRTGLTLREARVAGLGGVIVGRGSLSWQPQLAWKTTFDAKDLNPGRLWPQWPGQITLQGESDGTFGKTLRTRLAINQAHGRLRGQPLLLKAAGAIAGSHYTVERFDLRLGSVRAQAAGTLGERWDASWDVQAEDLGHLLPEAHGALATKGRLAGRRATPAVTATVNGRGVRYREYRIDAGDVEADVDLADTRDSHLSVNLRGVNVGNYQARAASVSAAGRASAHRLTAAVDEARGALRLVAHGRFQASRWHGTLAEATLTSRIYGDWRLETTGTFAMSRTSAALRRPCWRWQAARLCGEAEWQATQGWDAAFAVEHLPTSVFATWFAPGTALDGTIGGEARLQLAPAGRARGHVSLRAPAGHVGVPAANGGAVQLAYRSATLSVRLDDERLDSEISVGLAEGGGIEATLAAPSRFDYRVPGVDGAVRGRLKADIRDLAIVSAAFPQIERPRGALSADVALAGTLREPRFSGRARLDGGALDIGRLGLHLHDARLSANSVDGSAWALDGQVRSGDGVLRVSGQADLRPATWRGTLKLDGENFEAIKTPELWLRVSPALSVKAQPGRLDLQGKVHVPEGRFAPKDITKAVTVSPDAVIVADSGEAQPPERWQIRTQVQVSLGDKVRVEGYNFAGWMTGALTAQDEPGKATTGTGELRVVAGTYKVYGQKLHIDRGRLVFAGGPVSDPGLDVRAVRRVREVLAGVQARGTLKQPELTLFSEPPMDQADALSYLLVGRPANEAGRADGQLLMQAASSLGFAGGELLAKRIGQLFGIEEVRVESGETLQTTSLVVGTYLSPRLYVNYGIGLFEPVATLRLRYDISKRWQLQTETGTETSADLLYTIER